jgi:acyl dehydratase
MSYGRTFEELSAGQRFRHPLGRTISDFDDTLFSLMSMNQHPVHIDAQYASGTQHGQRLVIGPLVVAIVVGLTQADLGGRSVAVLDYEDVRHTLPVFHGDTIHAESDVVDLDAATHAVTVETRGLNQRGETVLTMRRRFVAP